YLLAAVNSDYPAWDHRILIKGIYGAHPMIAIGNDGLAVLRIPHEKNRGKFLAPKNFLAILFDVRIADPKQGQARCPENIFRFEFHLGSSPKLLDIFCSGLRIINQA